MNANQDMRVMPQVYMAVNLLAIHLYNVMNVIHEALAVAKTNAFAKLMLLVIHVTVVVKVHTI